MVSKENHVVTLEYTIKNDAELLAHEENLQQISMNNKPSDYEIIADKRDYLIAASCGLLAGLIDVFWVADFSLEKAQTWGREQTGQFVVAVAKMTGYQKDDLSGAIKHLEKQYCIPSDKLTPTFGGGLQHHLRDFSHHASLGGLLFSILSQFTGKAYGTNTVGEFTIVPFQDTSLIGTTIQEKLFNGVVVWFLHLVSDVDGTSKTAGRGTGIPGPILSFAKELSILPGIKQATIPYKGNRIPFSVWISKLFNGTAFPHEGYLDVKRFDFRTELGSAGQLAKQNVPIILCKTLIRVYYFFKRLCLEIKQKAIESFENINAINWAECFSTNNRCVKRMDIIASGVLSAVDIGEATVMAVLQYKAGSASFAKKLLLRVNYPGVAYFVISLKNDIVASIHASKQQDDSIVAVQFEIDTEVNSHSLYRLWEYTNLHNIKQNEQKFCCNESDDKGLAFAGSLHLRNLEVETGALLIRLFSLYNIPFEKAEDPLYYDAYPLIRKEKKKKSAYLIHCVNQGRIDSIQWDRLSSRQIKVLKIVTVGATQGSRIIVSQKLIQQAKKRKIKIETISITKLLSIINDKEASLFREYYHNYTRIKEKILSSEGRRELLIHNDNLIASELSYETFCAWLDRILGVIPKGSMGNYVNFGATIGYYSDADTVRSWELLFFPFSNEIVFPALDNSDAIHMMDSSKANYQFANASLTWGSVLRSDQQFEILKSFIQRYQNEGQFSKKLQEAKKIFCGSPVRTYPVC